MRKRTGHNRGFTLIEVMVTLMLLVILAGTSFSATKGVVARAEQDARNQVARSLFMAGQSALSHIYGNDPSLARQYAAMTPVSMSYIDRPNNGVPLDQAERDNNASRIVTITSNGGSGAQGAYLIDLLEPYVDDKAVLSGNIVLEYNRVTGNVLACFYSDETALLHGDGMGGYDAGYDVYKRDANSLSNAKVGYYGVGFTGIEPARLPVEEPSNAGRAEIQLVDYDDPDEVQGNDINDGKNYGLLTLECALPMENGDIADALRIEITVYCKKPGVNAGTPYTLTVGKNAGQPVDIDLASAAFSNNDLASALGNSWGDNTNNKAAAFIDTKMDASGRKILVIVLDAPYTTWGGIGGNAAYTAINDGNLVAKASVTVDTDPVRTVISPASRNALYKSVEAGGTGATSHYINSVSSVRHLNNVRYKCGEIFTQTRDIRVQDYKGDAFAMAPIGAVGSTQTGFFGNYKGNNRKISGLRVAAHNAALFAQIESGGRVEHVYLEDAEITGSSRAGGIAAVNKGTIYACTVYHQVDMANAEGTFIHSTGAGGVAGGIVADNLSSGTIMTCYVGTGVKASGDSGVAGGVAGTSAGTVQYCEVCTAMQRKIASRPGELVGKLYFGAANAGAYNYGDQTFEGQLREIDANQRWIRVTESGSAINYLYEGGVAGGVVGMVTDGTVEYCVNAAQVGADRGVAGGVVGSLIGAAGDPAVLQYSYNAGWVKAVQTAGGVVGQTHFSSIFCCYNTAPINAQLRDGYDDVTGFSWVLSPVHGGAAGGIAGRVYTDCSIRYCYNASYVCTEAPSMAYAGAFGRVWGESNADIEHCYFLKNSLNVSERYLKYGGNSVEAHSPVRVDGVVNRVTMLDKTAMMGLTDDTGAYGHLWETHLRVWTDNSTTPSTALKAGPYFKLNDPMGFIKSKQYLFPVLNDSSTLGTNFHRTPYYPVRESYPCKLDFAENPAGTYTMTVTVAQTQAVTLVLWLGGGTAPYYDYLNLSARLNAGYTGSLTFIGDSVSVNAQVHPPTLNGTDYTYVITFTLSGYADVHAQIVGPSAMYKISNNQESFPDVVWAENHA